MIIQKKKLDVVDEQELEVSKGAQILSAVSQEKNIYVYFLVDNEEETKETVNIRVHGTGDTLDKSISDYTFLNTVNVTGINEVVVLHVFYK